MTEYKETLERQFNLVDCLENLGIEAEGLEKRLEALTLKHDPEELEKVRAEIFKLILTVNIK